MEKNLTPIIKESFTQYAGAVLQSRALVDVRDCIKPSARQIFYSMWRNKYIHSKPYEKTNAPIGDCMKEFYIHGNTSALGIMMRAAQPFSMRIPLCEVKGNSGTLICSGNWAADRYTSTRLAEIADYLFADIQKDTIDDWRDNYADNLQYPAVLPTKGYYNLVNGTSGISVGMASSIPPFNLVEMNEMLIKLLWNPALSNEEAIIYPDFPTGATLLNKEEVKRALIVGQGGSCKLRSVINYDAKERSLTVSEIPYGVYTNTLCEQLEAILNDENNPGIERFNDLTGTEPNIKIYLVKTANANQVINYLYKNTSLQSFYTINMTMLQDGRFPKIFSLKEAMLEFLKHQKKVYTRGYHFDLAKIQKRLHIIEGLLKAISMIEEVIRTIKGSSSTAEANMALCKLLNIDSEQAKAILDIKLSRLAHLEIAKLTNEQANLKMEETKINEILSNETLLKKEIEKGLREVAEKFGDDRRTKILNVETEEGQVTDEKLYQVSMTNQNNLIITETSSLFIQKRGGVGTKTKLDKGEFVKFSKVCSNNDMLLFFTANGKCVKFQMNSLEFSVLDKKTPIAMLCKIEDDDDFTTFVPINFKDKQNEFILFITKNGLIKKSELTEYNFNRGSSINAIKLDAGDKIVSVLFTSKLPIGILTKCGNFIIIDTKEINPIGRMTRGVIGIKLNADDEVVDSQLIGPDTKEFLFVSQGGRAIRNSKNDYTIQGRGGKGIRVRKLDNDFESKFVSLSNEQELIVASEKSTLKLEISTLPLMSRGALGVQTIKLKEKEKISGISKF